MARSNPCAGAGAGPAARADIRQVAARAGLSTATVSRVLTGRGPASADAIRRVHAAARELDYLPNASASSLRTDRSMMIGVLVPDLANPVFLPFLRAVEHSAQPLGYAVVVADTQNSERIERQQLDRLIAQGIDGLVMAGRPRQPGQTRRLSRAGVPVTDPELFAEHAGTSIRAMTVAAIEEACRHLASLGHRRLAFVTRGAALQRASAGRWGTIQGACRDLGIEARHVALMIRPDADDPGAGLAATKLAALIRPADSPSVIWSNSLVLAPLLLEALAVAGIEIPARCSFLTFGDSPWATAYRPPISVVSGDLGSVASAMTESLLRRLGAVEAEPAVELRPDTYVARSSVGPAPGTGR
ncbi:MAG TPA: LacI family DNA-binding transcriptional regulator [Acidimicrobiales bacterium]